MKSVFVFSLFLAGCLCTPQWGGRPGSGGQWGGQAGGGQWGGQAVGRGGQGAWGQGGRSGWGQGGGSPGAWGPQGRRGRSPDGQQYGATIIDTPEQYGYEANIPGAQSRFVGYRSGRAGEGGTGQQAGSRGGWGQQGGAQRQW